MRRPNLFYTFILVLMSLIIVDDIQAQRRSTSSRRTSSRTSRSTVDDRRRTVEKEKLAEQWLAIHLGNVGFNGGFSLSTKFSYGFEFNDRFSIGANARFQYDFLNLRGIPDLNLLSYGIGPQARIKIVNEFFLIGEYNYYSLNLFDQSFNTFRFNEFSAAVGAGYKTGLGPWTYGVHILYPFDEIVRDVNSLEYWIDFNYKF